MSNQTSASGDQASASPHPLPPPASLPGNPDPDVEVIALSPRTLTAAVPYMCEVCGEGFERVQNLQLHRRGHNRLWKLKRKPADAVHKMVYLCPEAGCVHHDPARALCGGIVGIRKHFWRTHGEKKWKCDTCSKRYAVESDWKAHSRLCGTREYRCDDCGTRFSRRDSFITHRAFCSTLADPASAGEHHPGMLFAGGAGMQLPPGPFDPSSSLTPHQQQQMEMPGNVFGSASLDDQEYGGSSTLVTRSRRA